MELIVDGVNDALPRALNILSVTGLRHTAASVANERPTLEHPGVFITVYERPNCNVLFDPVRDANPFFHYLESMWILAGRNDVAFLRAVLPGMARYTDDGSTYHGAYGYRLRNWGGIEDQVGKAIELLRAKPTTRQVVMSIWNPTIDLGTSTKDMPCNDLIMLKVRNGRLHLTVANRSNDAILGAYGANAVQFSMLQMYIASALGLQVGRYTQVSDSMHVYEDDKYWQFYTSTPRNTRFPGMSEEYAGRCLPTNVNLFDADFSSFDTELDGFFESWGASAVGEPIVYTGREPTNPAVVDAYAMYNCVMHNRAKNYGETKRIASAINAPDWRMACQEWLQRREEKRNGG